MDSTGLGLNNSPKAWSKIPEDRADKYYNRYARGPSVHVKDTAILDWLAATQNKSEWNYYEYTGIVSMTTRVYTMFLLRWDKDI